MSESPKKKKMKNDKIQGKKRPLDNAAVTTKKQKSEQETEIPGKRNKFVTACERVSFQAYSDYVTRFLVSAVPQCLKEKVCVHQKENNVPSEVTNINEQLFNIEYKVNMWRDALEVCHLSMGPKQYLSSHILKNIVEIILNAHEDQYSSDSVTNIVDDCQQILINNFLLHPPCQDKVLRRCYLNFLTSPMDKKDNSFSNRSEYNYESGILRYCMNRLKFEISIESKDGPLLNKHEHIPGEMRQTVQGIDWQKQKFEIYEMLNRNERIGRLLAVLESTIELLQFDLSIWHSRHPSNQGRHILRSQKPLIAYILWSDNVLYTGAINMNCRLIMTLFIQFVCLGFRKEDVRVMTLWLNTLFQTFYVCETNSNIDYPNTGIYCSKLANEFYKMIKELPVDCIEKVLGAIEPQLMRYLVGMYHVKAILSTSEEDILKVMIEFVEKSRWKKFPESHTDLVVTDKSAIVKQKPIKKLLRYLTRKIEYLASDEKCNDYNYPRMSQDVYNTKIMGNIDQNHIFTILFITLDAYLKSYNVQSVQETIEKLNEQFESNIDDMEIDIPASDSSFCVSEQFIKKYRSIYKSMQHLIMLLHNAKERELPQAMHVFYKISLLNL